MNSPVTDRTALLARAMAPWRAVAAAMLLFLLLGVTEARGAAGTLTALSPATVGAGVGTARVAVSPDGKNVYVSNKESNTVSQYSRNTGTGELTALSQATIGAGEGPIGCAIS